MSIRPKHRPCSTAFSWASRRACSAAVMSRSTRAIRWARVNPWRFALLPAAAVAAIVFVLSVVLGGGIVGPVFAGLWHGAVAFGLTGAVGTYARGRRPASRV